MRRSAHFYGNKYFKTREISSVDQWNTDRIKESRSSKEHLSDLNELKTSKPFFSSFSISNKSAILEIYHYRSIAISL
jgi:hypothetical protein